MAATCSFERRLQSLCELDPPISATTSIITAFLSTRFLPPEEGDVFKRIMTLKLYLYSYVHYLFLREVSFEDVTPEFSSRFFRGNSNAICSFIVRGENYKLS